jgi:hypothetical protein
VKLEGSPLCSGKSDLALSSIRGAESIGNG